MHDNPMKFENPIRLEELDVETSLKRTGVKPGDTVCDYGAGTGIFAVAAASMTEAPIYALDMDQKMLDIIDQKKRDLNLSNIRTKKVEPDCLPLEEGSVDHLLLVTVLHEILDVPSFVERAVKVLKPDGKIMIIDFLKKEDNFGPPIQERVSAYQAARFFHREGIEMERQYDLGENLYLLILKK